MTLLGIMMEGMLESMAEYYSVELAQKVNRNMCLNAEKGQFNGGKPALGYKLEIQDFGTYKKKVLVIDENTAPIVKKVFEMRANDVPVKDIIKFLNDNKYKNSRNRPFNKNSLQHLFNNKKYIGINTYGKEEFPNAVPRIIDDELFEKVQNIKEKYKHSPGIKKATERYLLTGKIFCRTLSVATILENLETLKLQKCIDTIVATKEMIRVARIELYQRTTLKTK